MKRSDFKHGRAIKYSTESLRNLNSSSPTCLNSPRVTLKGQWGGRVGGWGGGGVRERVGGVYSKAAQAQEISWMPPQQSTPAHSIHHHSPHPPPRRPLTTRPRLGALPSDPLP